MVWMLSPDPIWMVCTLTLRSGGLPGVGTRCGGPIGASAPLLRFFLRSAPLLTRALSVPHADDTDTILSTTARMRGLLASCRACGALASAAAFSARFTSDGVRTIPIGDDKPDPSSVGGCGLRGRRSDDAMQLSRRRVPISCFRCHGRLSSSSFECSQTCCTPNTMPGRTSRSHPIASAAVSKNSSMRYMATITPALPIPRLLCTATADPAGWLLTSLRKRRMRCGGGALSSSKFMSTHRTPCSVKTDVSYVTLSSCATTVMLFS
mmetsp:Transcript_3668/g.8839  ORF Transcript_3668/g.8839 Transcript_3668/m.8839 type:complete len:265 (-) Transcript_3668:1523-2317(-)